MKTLTAAPSRPWAVALALGAMLAPALGLAQDTPVPDKGDTAWMMTSTVLVILMTIPGLALFYGGMVRSKNVLSLLMQVFVTFCLMALLWAIYGYSLAFTDGNAFIGGFDRLFLSGHDDRARWPRPSARASTSRSSLFVVFQLTFAAITPCLIVGAFAERIKFSAVLLFVVLWFTFSYLPIAHMVWWWAGPDAYTDAAAGAARSTAGFLFQKGALDFAGGTVVHINAGIAGLVGALMRRQAHRLRHRGDAAAQRADGDDRRLAAVGGLVRLQRRLGPRSQRLRRPGVRQHLPGHRGCRAGLVIR